MTVATNATAELDAAQVAHDLDELIMEDDESVDGETPLEGIPTLSYSIYATARHCRRYSKFSPRSMLDLSQPALASQLVQTVHLT